MSIFKRKLTFLKREHLEANTILENKNQEKGQFGKREILKKDNSEQENLNSGNTKKESNGEGQL